MFPTRRSEAREFPMAYWLMKSEPEAWSWEQQKKEGVKGAEWDGVRNFQARNNMRAMKKGDLAFFYHSGDEKQAVGIVKVVKEAHPNSTDATGQWECVDVAAVKDVAAAGDACQDQGHAGAESHGSRAELPPLGAAGHGQRMAQGLRHGRARRPPMSLVPQPPNLG